MRTIKTISLYETEQKMINELKDLFALTWPDGSRSTLKDSEIIRYCVRTTYIREKERSKEN